MPSPPASAPRVDDRRDLRRPQSRQPLVVRLGRPGRHPPLLHRRYGHGSGRASPWNQRPARSRSRARGPRAPRRPFNAGQSRPVQVQAHAQRQQGRDRGPASCRARAAARSGPLRSSQPLRRHCGSNLLADSRRFQAASTGRACTRMFRRAADLPPAEASRFAVGAVTVDLPAGQAGLHKVVLTARSAAGTAWSRSAGTCSSPSPKFFRTRRVREARLAGRIRSPRLGERCTRLGEGVVVHGLNSIALTPTP